MKAKLYLLRCIYFSLMLLLPAKLFSQNKITPDNPLYDKLKAEGKLPDYKNRFLKATKIQEFPGSTINPEIQNTSTFFKACKEFIPVDTTFLVVPFLAGTLGPPPFYRNDDASTSKLTIPFNFCFY